MEEWSHKEEPERGKKDEPGKPVAFERTVEGGPRDASQKKGVINSGGNKTWGGGPLGTRLTFPEGEKKRGWSAGVLVQRGGREMELLWYT